ncbi:MAG: L-serine ammonia-lyase, iron-sulfur-dependent, subunit alpha [Spirochaetales bacterium]|jgi:L-cysteine desulfidase|nr:L-serine ammonia-lyase, iron-sulfur-dependent, subunit alpha [Spirochaetales bacterium]
MHPLTEIIKNDMAVSLGVTEPGAIALAVSRARSLVAGDIRSVVVEINSGIYKNAFTCGIPGTEETGNVFAAALGAVAGDYTKGLASLDGVRDGDIKMARRLLDSGKVSVRLREISSALYIKATVETETDSAAVTILGAHDNIAEVVKNGIVLEKKNPAAHEKNTVSVSGYTLADFWRYAGDISFEEIEFIQQAYDTNIKLMEAGLNSEFTDICKTLLADNGGVVISNDELKTAHVMTAAAIEARVRGLKFPAMSITGSGNHGIICTMPLYACARVRGLSREILLRATALSYLTTMYIKEYSGKLSAFCGCAIAAGTGACVGRLFMMGGSLDQAGIVINNMASGLTGVICTGGNPACVLKAGIAIDIGYKAIRMALRNTGVDPKHGIIGQNPEQTMRYIGRIADPGMVQTEKVIVEIFEEKLTNTI